MVGLDSIVLFIKLKVDFYSYVKEKFFLNSRVG